MIRIALEAAIDTGTMLRTLRLAVVGVAIGLGATAQAATYTWTSIGSPLNWDNSGGQNNWTSGFPNAVGDVAIVNTNITSNSTINLNQAITIGTLNIGDSTGSRKFTIAPNGGSLKFDVSTGNAAITRVATGTGADAVSAGITLNDDIDVTVSSTSGSLTLSGIIVGSGKALNKLGAGTLTLSVANTYSGATTISGGTLSISGSINNSTAVNVNGGLLSTTGADKLANTAVVTVAGGTLTVGGADTVSTLAMSSGAIGGTNTLTATTYGLSGGTVTGNLGTGTINSSGAVALNGTAAATAVNVTAGTLTLGSANRLANGATVAVSGTGILDMSTFADTVSIFNMSAGSLNGSGTLTATTYGLSGGTVTGNLGTGTINSSGAVALNGTAAATAVNVTAGTLTLGSANRLADGATVAVSGGTLAMAFNDTVGAVALSNGTISGVGTLTGSSYALTNTGTISANLGSSTAALTKTGAGTATLFGNNAYSGATTVSDGTLLVNGNQSSATGAVTVASGATLGGSGTIGGAVTVSGTLSPGNSPGTLNVGTVAAPKSVTMEADSIYDWEFDGTVGDKVSIQGDLTLTSGWKLALVDAGGTPTQNVKYDLFTYTGSFTGSIEAAIDYGATGWGTASVGQEAGKVYLMFGTRSDVLLVAGSPAYDEATSTGLKGGTMFVAPGWSVSNSGTAVGYATKYTSGANMGNRAVRWDYTGTAATELGTLGTSGGVTYAVAFAVNNAGTAVGRSDKYDGSGVSQGSRAVRWDASGAAFELAPLSLTSTGFTTAEAMAVNAGGTAVGSSAQYDGDDTLMGTRPVRWDAAGAVTELGNLGLTGGFTLGVALAINDANTAVGWVDKPGWGGISVGKRAVRWDASGAVTELDNLGVDINGQDTTTLAFAVNAVGTAVGWAAKFVDNGSTYLGNRAVRWDAPGKAVTELGTLGESSIGRASGIAYAVNDAGTAAGYAEKYDSGTLVGTRAVRWAALGGAATELGNLGLDVNNSTSASAYAVNSAGSAVGYAQKYDGSHSYVGDRAVIWLPDASAIDLNDLGVAPVSGGGTWTLTTARALSADGWVAGSGTFDPDGGGPLASYLRHWVTQVGLGGTWTNAAGGTWGRGPNWSTGTPAMQVGNATFGLGSVYAVGLDRDELTKTIAINAGTVTIDSNDHTLTAENGLSIANGATLKADGPIVGDIDNDGTLELAPSSGTLIYGGTISGAGNLAKSGVSMVRLAGANSYSGLTTVTAGTLALDLAGTIDNSTTITVGDAGSTGAVLDLTAKPSFNILSGQTLKGIGTVNIGGGKTVTVDVGGRWAPGNSIGANAVTGDLALSGDADFELGTAGASHEAPGTSDRTAVSGALTLGGTLNLSDNAGANGQGSVGGGSYLIFTQTGAAGGSFATINNVAGYHAKVNIATSGSVFLDNYQVAAANTIATPVELGNVHVGGAGASALSIANTGSSILSEGLNATKGAVTGNATVSGTDITNLAGGASSTDISVGVNTATAGAKTGAVTIGLASNGANSGYADTPLDSQVITVNGSVYSGLSTWTGPSGGSWGTLSSGFGVNWGANQGSPGLDSGFTGVDTATFGSTSGSVTVNLDGAAPSLNAVTFNGTGSYTIAQGGGATGLTLAGATPTITVTGAHAISAPISGSSLTKSGAGTLTLSGVNTYTGQTIVTEGTLQLNGVIKTTPSAWDPVISLTGGGADIQGDQGAKLVFDYTGGSSPAPGLLGIDALMKASYHGDTYGVGLWDVGKFHSTTAATTGLTLGWVDSPTQVTVMATYAGDANLDGEVDGADVDIWKLNVGTGKGAGMWALADFNYDGEVDGADVDIWKLKVGSSLGLSELSTGGTGLSIVPEPGTLALLATGLLGLLCYAWRRRRS
jgi:autotransporter-associated beta strand protein